MYDSNYRIKLNTCTQMRKNIATNTIVSTKTTINYIIFLTSCLMREDDDDGHSLPLGDLLTLCISRILSWKNASINDRDAHNVPSQILLDELNQLYVMLALRMVRNIELGYSLGGQTKYCPMQCTTWVKVRGI